MPSTRASRRPVDTNMVDGERDREHHVGREGASEVAADGEVRQQEERVVENPLMGRDIGRVKLDEILRRRPPRRSSAVTTPP